MRRWNIDKCRQAFDHIVKKFFSAYQKSPTTVGMQFRRLILGCIKDGIYNAQDLESCLQETYGLHEMFSKPPEGPSGQKVAVIATPMQGGHARVFSNYNASSKGYGMLKYVSINTNLI